MASTDVENFKLTNPALLDKIDKLRDAGVSNFIALPQLVVVGDQSSGKSSVLEGLTSLPFPRDSGLCTRFATQITFRRAVEEGITISVIPSSTSTNRKKLQAFRKTELKSLNGSDFLVILKAVCNLMGIPGPNQALSANQQSFSEDVLKIELCGPERQHLTIIDVPGIFRTPEQGVTTKEDMAMVRRIMHKYIRDERTIILAVIPANTDIATQEILSMAEEVDPKGIRTLGVLTKPDLVDKGGEHNVMELVRNKKHELKLGYCIVRNRGQQELSSDSRERLRKEKEFFTSEPWCHLEKDRVGTESLQDLLRELLQDITRREFPKLRKQIDQQLAKNRMDLKALGQERDTPEQQRRYLQSMAIEYGKITDAAIDAHYSRHDAFTKLPELRLPTLIVDRSEKFSNDIETKGHTIQFLTDDEIANKPAIPVQDGKSGTHSKNMTAMMKSLGITIDDDQYPELSDLLVSDWKCPEPETRDVLKWIGDEYRKARGNGLVSLGPAVIPTMWQQQCLNWDGLAHAYISDIILLVHHFTAQLLGHVCPDERVRANLLSMLVEPMVEQYKKAVMHVEFIVLVERGGIMTYNHYYNSNLQDARMNRLKASLKKAAQPFNKNSSNWVDVDLVTANIPMGNFEHDIKEIHDILKAYYKVARKRFVDNICMMASDHYLVSSEDSPLRMFSPVFVSSLTNDQLEAISGEDPSAGRKRKSLKAEIEALEQGKKVLRA